MAEKTLIIHGYSDCSESFIGIKDFLSKNNIPSESIFYADYQSREDNLTFHDIIDGLNDELIRLELIDKNGGKKYDFNVIVHSTGGLVIRHWITRFYSSRMQDCPIKRLIMLAPANFGSPLAVRGKSFLGQLFKGRWKIGDFLEVGRQILDGLELASPYQWKLAHQDLLCEKSFYNSDLIQTTVLVGADDYTGLRGWINKPGTDGTVVISGTSLNTIKLSLSFSRPTAIDEYVPFKWNTLKSNSKIAFGVLPGLNHGSIVEQAGQKDVLISELLLKAINTKTTDDFNQLVTDLNDITNNSYYGSGKRPYQQFVLHAIDDQGNSLPDYSLEFFIFRASRVTNNLVQHDDRHDVLEDGELDFSNQVNHIITREFATNSTDSSFRRFLVDPVEITELIERAKQELGEDVVLSMKVYVDEIDDKIGFDNNEIEKIVLYCTKDLNEDVPSLFFPNTTTFIEIRVDRLNKYVIVGNDPIKE